MKDNTKNDTKKVRIVVCPNCGSEELDMLPRAFLNLITWGRLPFYTCKECGYQGGLVMELDNEKDLEKFRELRMADLKKGKKVPSGWFGLGAYPKLDIKKSGEQMLISGLFLLVIAAIGLITDYFYLSQILIYVIGVGLFFIIIGVTMKKKAKKYQR